MSFYAPQYTSLQLIKNNLRGKVQFSNDNPKYMSDNDVLDNIETGEGWVEFELSRQYIVSPSFIGVGPNGEDIPFKDIQPKSTVKIIEKLCTLQTCIFILETSFGKSEGVRGEEYLDNYIKEYEKLRSRALGVDQISDQYNKPPLNGLKLDPQASFFHKGIPFPMASTIGSHPASSLGRLNQRAIQGQPNPFRNWFYNNGGRHNGGNC